jgi:hypothetical protein
LLPLLRPAAWIRLSWQQIEPSTVLAKVAERA